MSNKSIGLDDRLYQYLISASLREPEILRQLREETASLPKAHMQISPEQGQFMALLVKLAGVRKVLEVGVFTGYSSLSVALALPAEGRITACDIDEGWTSMARRYWEKAEVADKIDLRLAPAVDTLAGLLADNQADRYDFAFIDADKENYDAYYEKTLQLLRPGGLLLIDNVLWEGRVADDAENGTDTVAIRALNRKIHDDSRVDISLVPVADGITLALKR
ncbi:MAG: class I SAM-dependent methyltransferase [Methylococcaceae bacterium]|nr:class I SAM-dependent methyltransferase [Methylococcaceae bacterium]